MTVEQAAIFLLVAIFAFCVWGLWTKAYRENLLQFFGMVGMVLYCVIRFAQVMERDFADTTDVLGYAAVLLFALGVALKVDRHRREEKRRLLAKRDRGPMSVIG